MEKAVYHVEPAGRDRSEGSKRAPWGSLPGAVQNIREKRRRRELSGAVELRLGAGVYRLGEPLKLGPEDSGLEMVGDGRGKVVISGGRVVEGLKEERLDGRRVWVADFPTAWKERRDFRQLWVNGKRRPRARYPKFGSRGAAQKNLLEMAEVRGLDEPNFLAGADYAFRPRAGDIEKWDGLYDAEIVALHFWIEERLTHPHFDPATGWVECSRQAAFRLTEDFSEKPARYYIDNLREALTDPGEWYYAKREGRLYYLPMPAEKLETTELVVPLVRKFIEVAGNRYNLSKTEGDIHGTDPVRDIRISGLTFQYADWRQPMANYLDHDKLNVPQKPLSGNVQAAVSVPAVIDFRVAEDCVIEDCRIEHVGTYGIEFGRGVRRCTAVGNTLTDLGGGGIKINGTELDGPAHGRTGHCSVTDNTIKDGGLVFHSSVGILIGCAFENVVAHNRIENLFYTGISIGWSWGYRETITRDNLILNNRINNIGQGLLSDMGAIYTLGVQPGTVIAGNHVSGVKLHAYGGWGLYLDEGSSHMLVEGNLVHDIQGPCFNIHFGRENILRNNLFIGGKGGIASMGRAEKHVAANFMQNVFVPTGGLVFCAGYGGSPDQSFRSEANIIVRFKGKPLHYFDKPSYENPDKVPWKEWTAKGGDLLSAQVEAKGLPLRVLERPERADWARILGKKLASHGIAFPDWKRCGPRSVSKRIPLRQPLTRFATRLEDLT
ncbi:MAG: right-handed parallel beta-helix repeat-containing protein [Oceanipulchritudo sp.]